MNCRIPKNLFSQVVSLRSVRLPCFGCLKHCSLLPSKRIVLAAFVLPSSALYCPMSFDNAKGLRLRCQRFISRGESEAKLTGGEPAKHTKYAKHPLSKRSLLAGFRIRSPKKCHCEERSDVAISGLTAYCLCDVSRLSFFVRRLSSVVRHPGIRSSSFNNYFLLKNTHHRTHSRSTSCP
jgi:hypothetical protein